MDHDPLHLDHVNWYHDQVVFLTGATGNLGGCIPYKSAVQLPTKKIYVLCRRSIEQAMDKWEASMPEQVKEIFESGKVLCLIGDTTEPHLGLRKVDRDRLQQEVTVIIHGAASISMFQELHEAVHHLPGDNVRRLYCRPWKHPPHKRPYYPDSVAAFRPAILPLYQYRAEGRTKHNCWLGSLQGAPVGDRAEPGHVP